MTKDSNLRSVAGEKILRPWRSVLAQKVWNGCGLLAGFVVLLFSQGISLAGDRVGSKELSEATLFAFGGIGSAGILSKGEVAFRNVLDSESAVADFRQILKTGSPQAQCYALVGLRIKDHPAFDEEVKRFLSSKEPVQTGAGCMLSAKPMSSVAGNIRNGTYDAQAKEKPRTR